MFIMVCVDYNIGRYLCRVPYFFRGMKIYVNMDK